MEMPSPPPGTGEHPICLTLIKSGDLEKSRQFYAELFGWQMMPLSAEVCACATPAQQACALRSTGMPEGQSAVPFVRMDDVDSAVTRFVDLGFTVEKAKWSAPGVGDMARVTTPSATVIGLIAPQMPDMTPAAPLPSPFGDGPKPVAGAICAIELYSGNFEAAARVTGNEFGWGTLETMPSYMAFDTGAGYSGIYQSHTPNIPVVPYIYCVDVTGKVAEIEAAGGKRLGDPMSMPGIATFGYFNDPTGTVMGLIGPS